MNSTASSLPDQFPVLHLLQSQVLAPFIFSLLIGLPSVALLAIELAILIRQRQNFQSSFYTLFAARATSSLFCYAGNFLGQRFGRVFPWMLPFYLDLPRLLLALFFFFMVYSLHVEFISSAILLVNRLTAILYPLNYEKFWRKAMPISLAFMFTIPLPYTYHIFGLAMFVHVQEDGSFTLDNHKYGGEPDDTKIAAIASFVFGIICLLLNLACLIAYKRTSGKKTNQNTESNAMEAKLTKYAILTFGSHVLMGVYMIILNQMVFCQAEPAILCQYYFLAVFNQYPWIYDITTMVTPAWLLLWASTQMRKSLRKLFRPIKMRLNCNFAWKPNRIQNISDQLQIGRNTKVKKFNEPGGHVSVVKIPSQRTV